MTRPTDAIDPIVPRLPAENTPTLATDGGRTRDRDFDRQPDTSHSPNDRCTEEIEPFVADMR